MTNKSDDALLPCIISETNLSYAWARVLWHMAKTPRIKVQPLLISLRGLSAKEEVAEDPVIRSALDDFLRSTDDWSVEFVAFTIFPQKYWQIADKNRQEFYQLCFDALPHLRARNRGRDLYFGRLIQFGAAKHNDNQLEFILKAYSEGKRRVSMFQALIFDPTRDQTQEPYQTFPCLQSVSFVPTDDGLVVNAVYAMQYVVRRCYGNLLGLSQLGRFMAGEMKMPLAQLNMMAGVEKRDFPKSSIANLVNVIGERVPDLEFTHEAGA